MGCDLEIRHLSYGVLKDLSFYIPHGAKVGIVGRTGAGKSTLLNLIMKIYLPPSSTIFLDGVDILEIPDIEYKKLVGGVLQENFFFSASIRENLLVADEINNGESKLLDALICSSFNVDEFPGKLEEIIGERGIRLSGGQKERLALARAILKNPKILVLDDAFANVDVKTEMGIQQGLIKLDATVILASHRVLFMKDYDMIFCLEDGRLVESGTPGELLSKSSLFKRFYDFVSDWIF